MMNTTRRYVEEANWAGLDLNSYMLMNAIEHGFFDEAKFQIDKGADVNRSHSQTRKCPLGLATEKRNKEMVSLLLLNGADTECKVSIYTPLELASMNGQKDIVAMLIKYGAKINITEGPNESALQLASKNGHNTVVKLLIKSGADVNCGFYEPPLVSAVRKGHIDVVKTLIDGGAMIDYQDRNKCSVLETALVWDKKDIAKILIEHGANTDGALDKAFQNKSSEIVEILLNKKIDIKHKDKYGKTLFMIAVTHGELKLMSDLIEKGSDIEEKDNNGMTALMLASSKVHLKAVEMLIEDGANVNEKSNEGLTALMYASGTYLQSKDVVKKLIESGSCVNERSKDGSTALMFAVVNQDTEFLTFLIDNGADLNIKRNNGDTALIIATAYDQIKTVEVLIDGGADVNVFGEGGLSPRLIATHSIKYSCELLKILEKKSSMSKQFGKEYESLSQDGMFYETPAAPEKKSSENKINITQSADPLQMLTVLPLDTDEQTKLDENDMEVLSRNLQSSGPRLQDEIMWSETSHKFSKQLKKRKHSKRKRKQLLSTRKTISKGHGLIIKDSKLQAPASDQGDDPYKESHSTVFADNTATVYEDTRGSQFINTHFTELTDNIATASKDITGKGCKNKSFKTQLTDNSDKAFEDRIFTKCNKSASTELKENTGIACEEETWMECTNVNGTISKCIAEHLSGSKFSIVSTESFQSLLKTAAEMEKLIKNVSQKQNKDFKSDEAAISDPKTEEWPEWATSIKILQQLPEFSSASKLSIFDTGQSQDAINEYPSQLYPVIINWYHIEHVEHAHLQNPLNVNIKDATYCVIDEKT